MVLIILIFAFTIAVFGRKMALLYVRLGLTFNLHMNMVKRVLYAKFKFFMRNPDGRISTRFS